MVGRPSELFSRLPSVNELLDKQPVRVLVDRWNRSAVADSVRSFLGELRNDIERRAADFQMPSLREIAERAARHVAAQRQSQLHPIINATGRLFGPECTSLPLADAALERMISVGRGFLLNSTSGSSAPAQLCRRTGAEAALIASSYSGAISLALAALAAGQEAIVAKGDLGEMADGGALATLAQASGIRLRDVGAVDRATIAEFESAFTDQTAAILRHDSETYCIQSDSACIDAADLVALARRRHVPLVELVGSAPLCASLPWLSVAPRSAAERIASGASIVVLRGDGLLGGPRCGILLGSRSLVDRVAAHPLRAAWAANPATLVALEATLALYDDLPSMAYSLPLAQLLATSLENLRQRADRLAPQLAQAADVSAADSVEHASRLGLANLPHDDLPSCAVALTAVDGNVDALEKRLRSAAVPIVGTRAGDRLVLNLRTVFPRQEQALVELVAGPAASAVETPPEAAAPASL